MIVKIYGQVTAGIKLQMVRNSTIKQDDVQLKQTQNMTRKRKRLVSKNESKQKTP